MEKNVTVVTCYYSVKSKHSPGYYKAWISNFFKFFTGNIIIFTNEKTKKQLTKIINHPEEKLMYIIQELEDTEICKKYNEDFWINQYNLDNPKRHGNRTKECYIIWNSKFNFLKKAIEINPFNSKKFVWNDIGSLREKLKILSYPNYEKISSDKLDIVCLKIPPEKEYFSNEVHFSGSIFGGTKEIIMELCEKYYKIFEEYSSKNLFIGCDQQLISTLYIRNKENFNLVHSNDWFFLYKYYK